MDQIEISYGALQYQKKINVNYKYDLKMFSKNLKQYDLNAVVLTVKLCQ